MKLAASRPRGIRSNHCSFRAARSGANPRLYRPRQSRSSAEVLPKIARRSRAITHLPRTRWVYSRAHWGTLRDGVSLFSCLPDYGGIAYGANLALLAWSARADADAVVTPAASALRVCTHPLLLGPTILFRVGLSPVAHAPDGAVTVFADEEAAVFGDGDSHRTTPDFAVG